MLPEKHTAIYTQQHRHSEQRVPIWNLAAYIALIMLRLQSHQYELSDPPYFSFILPNIVAMFRFSSLIVYNYVTSLSSCMFHYSTIKQGVTLVFLAVTT